MQCWIDKAVKLIIEQYAPEQIILFGSCATGKYTAKSDVDLLIIKNTDLPRLYRGLEITNYLMRYPIKFDLLFYTPDELMFCKGVKHSFIDSILRTGVILYGSAGARMPLTIPEGDVLT